MDDKRQLYQDFLKAFPIDSLEDMTLEQYTDLKKENSFCYWLEAKTSILGSIWGGASYKFGIYEYKKRPNNNDKCVTCDGKYAWYKKYNKDTAQDAFAVVKKTIIKIAHLAQEAKWEEIDKMTELGHAYKWKIAFMYSNEQLIPILKKELLGLVALHFGIVDPAAKSYPSLQLLLMEKKGDKDLYDFYEELLAILKQQKPRVWMYAPGPKASKWGKCLKNEMMCIGWDDLGDLSSFSTREEIKTALQEANNNPEGSFMNDSLALWDFVHTIQIGDIVYAKKGADTIIGRGIVEGDYFYDESSEDFKNIRNIKWTNVGEWKVPQKNIVQKTLTDISDYKSYVKELDALIEVKENNDNETKQYWWLVASPKVWSFSDMSIGEEEFYSLYNENGNPRKIFQNFLDVQVGDTVIVYEASPIRQITGLAEISKSAEDGKRIYIKKIESFNSPIEFSTIKEMTEFKNMEFLKNPNGSLFKITKDESVILMGVIREKNPKPYSKKDFLSEVYMEEDTYESIVNLLEMKKNIILQGAPGVGKTFTANRLAYSILGCIDEDKVKMIQFHQSYSYEDFIMGYKPDGSEFKLTKGVFYKFCKKAQSDPKHEYFFIIDEINRGNLSKIFGELLMLIENGYRGKEIELAYDHHELFSVPKNLYIIGMMNTADRSLAMIDYALRRRFSFVEMKPGFDTRGFEDYKNRLSNPIFDKVINGIKALNETIANDDSLGAGFCIGHSYFCNQTNFSMSWLENVIDFDIIPMLKEYWFDNKETCENEIQKLKDCLKSE